MKPIPVLTLDLPIQVGKGDLLQTEDGDFVTVDGIKLIKEGSYEVYNFEVEDFHTYFVSQDGVLVYNTNCNISSSKRVNPQDLINDLADFQSRRFNIGSETFQLDKSAMKHILEDHHPKYYNPRKTNKKFDTFFDSKLNINEIENAIDSVIRQNRDEVMEIGTNAFSGNVQGIYKGVVYDLGFFKGRIGQFYTLHPDRAKLLNIDLNTGQKL